MRELPVGTHGAVDRRRLHQLWGGTEMTAALRRGQLVPYGRRVLVDRRCVTDFRCRCAAALLRVPGAVLSGQTALVLHGCTAADQRTVHLLAGYHRKNRPPPGVAIHHGSFSTGDVVRVDDLPMLAPELAAAQVLCTARRNIALGCVDQLLASVPGEHRTQYRAEIAARIAERVDSRGRRQGEVLLSLATGLPESPMESSVLLQVFDAGFPVPTPQFVIRALDGREVWRLDFAWPELKIALEYDGYEAHEHRAEADRQRDADLQRRGWLVVRAGIGDIADNCRLMAALRAAFAQRGIRL